MLVGFSNTYIKICLDMFEIYYSYNENLDKIGKLINQIKKVTNKFFDIDSILYSELIQKNELIT